jgi:hypothetical protein
MAGAVDSWKARFAVSTQAHVRMCRFGDWSNRRTWSNTFASITAFAPSSHRVIWDNAYVASENSLLMIHKNGVEEETMWAYPSKDTSCTEGFNFKTAGAVDSCLATRPTSSLADSRVSGFGDSSNLKMWSSAFASTTPFAPSTHRERQVNAAVASRITPECLSLN